MPADLTVRRADRLVHVRLTGRVTGDEIAETARAISQHRRFKPHFRVLWDASEVSALDVPQEAFERLVAQEREFRERGEDGELVFVVQDDVWASLVTLFSGTLRESARPIHVVATTEAAFVHLGVAG